MIIYSQETIPFPDVKLAGLEVTYVNGPIVIKNLLALTRGICFNPKYFS